MFGTELWVLGLDVSLPSVNHLAYVAGNDRPLTKHQLGKPGDLGVAFIGEHGEVGLVGHGSSMPCHHWSAQPAKCGTCAGG